MSRENYYDSIDDIIFYNWRKCIKGDLRYTRLDLKRGNQKSDQKYWGMIYDSYLSEFGLGNDFIHYLDLKLELAQLECDFVITGNRFLLNRIDVLTAMIHDLMTKETGGDMDTLIIYVSKWLGQIINDKEITAKMFFKMANEYKKASTEPIKKSA